MAMVAHNNKKTERIGIGDVGSNSPTRDIQSKRNLSRNQPEKGLAPPIKESAELARGRDEWESIPSAPGAQMRANSAIGMAEIRYEGQLVGVTGLAAIKDWSAQHHLTGIDEDRLVDLDLQARRRNINQTTERSKNSFDGSNDFDGLLRSGFEHEVARPIAQEKSSREKVTVMDQAKPQGPALDAQRIGQNMPKSDWQEAINLLKSKAPGEQGRIYLPKERGEYGGQVLLVTDTHIVQRVGRGTAIAHDMSKLANSKELAADFDSGKTKPGHTMRVTYGSEHEGGKATMVPFNQQRAEEVRSELGKWAEQNITNARGRETFLKHLDSATKNMGAPATREMSPPTPNRTGPSKDR